eukprot:121521_1
MSNRSNKKKQSYLQIDVSDDTDVENENDPLTKRKEEDKETATPATEEKPKTFCQWLFSNPFSKGPFLYFLVGILASAGNGVFYLMDNDTAFIISGILGASICVVALKHFYRSLGLKATIDNTSRLNLRFADERKKISFEVDRIKKANTELRKTHDRLMRANEKNRENLDQFREIQANMEMVGEVGLGEMTNVSTKEHAKAIEIHSAQLYERQKHLLNIVYDRIEQQGSGMGMNENEFKEFLSLLPDDYKLRFDRIGTFQRISNGTSLIQYNDFSAAVELFAQMETDNVDIKFEIQKSPSIDLYDIKFEIKKSPSIDLSDIKFDEYDDGDNAPALYDRKIVVTKRDLSIAALMDNDNDYGSGSGSDHENATEKLETIDEEEEKAQMQKIMEKHQQEVNLIKNKNANLEITRLPLQQYSNTDIIHKIKFIVYHNNNYDKHLKQTMQILIDLAQSGHNIIKCETEFVIGTAFLRFMSKETFNMILSKLTQWKETDSDSMKTAEMGYFIYNYPLQKLVERINDINNTIDGQKFIQYMNKKHVQYQWIKSTTGWNERIIYQIESALVEYKLTQYDEMVLKIMGKHQLKINKIKDRIEDLDMNCKPLHRYDSNDISARIKWFIFKDINYNKYLLQTIQILTSWSQSGENIVRLGLKTMNAI